MTNFNILFEELITVTRWKSFWKHYQEHIFEPSTKLIISRNQKTLFLKSEVLNWVIGGKQNSKSEIEIKANEYLSKTDCINRQSNVKIT
jgi:hypothetical protein